MRLALALIAAAMLVACGDEGRPVRTWSLHVEEAGPREVVLPASLLAELELRDVRYTLRTVVELAPDEVGQPLTLVVGCFHQPLRLRVDGADVPDAGDVGVGEHRFLIPAGGRVRNLELTARNAFSVALGFGEAPRLIRGTRLRPSAAARFNRGVALFELGLVAVFVLLFGTSYALDRRRRADAAFAVGVASASVAPLWQLGVISAPAVIGILTCVTNVAVLYFVHATFELPGPPRWLVRAFGALAAANALAPLAPVIPLALTVMWLGISVAFGNHVLKILIRHARRGPRRGDARLLLATLVIIAILVVPDVLGFVTGDALLGGAHTASLGLLGFSVAQALSLARQQVGRQRALEQTATELQRQVAERSRELSAALAQLPSVSRGLEPGRVVDGRYRVAKQLGAGGMGAVYEVERVDDGRRLALKTLRGLADRDAMARFAREAQLAAELDHPNLVPVLDVGISDDGLFLVMPLVAGGSLEDHRARFGDAVFARRVLPQIAAGLAALHARGIVHRDLKPANVLLADGVARLADFGLAALKVDALADTAAASPALTRAGDVMGTPLYMAPELAAGPGGPAADVFALGVIAHELLTGARPFTEPPALARDVAITPGDVPAWVARCLSVSPDERPTATDIEATVGR